MQNNTNQNLLKNISRKVLVCTDFSENSDFAFDYAINLIKSLPSESAHLHLLHVVPETQAQFWKTYVYEVDDVDNKARSDIDKKIDNYRQKAPENITFNVEIRIGNDYQEIIDYANHIIADLIVIGRETSTSFAKAFLGDLTEKIARHAKCAVLVVPISYKKQLKAAKEKKERQ
jgi:nucleotide-binding universal stress UspA family protein